MMSNKTMYGLKLYIPFEDLDAYIHEHIEEAHKDHTFIPVKVEVNEIDLGIDISLISAIPNEIGGCGRYKLDLSKLPKNEKTKRGLRAQSRIYDEVMPRSDAQEVIETIKAGKLPSLNADDTCLDWR